MTDPKPAEPSMEEILASIRQIINQNDAPAEGETQAADAPMLTAPAVAADADLVDDAPEDDDILELTAILEDEPEPQSPPLILQEAAAPVSPADSFSPAAAAVQEPETAPLSKASGDHLITGMTAAAATAALNNLAATLQQERAEHTLPLGNASRTLESMVVESMKPLLKEWLDANLPQLVERVVQQELEKLTRRLGA